MRVGLVRWAGPNCELARYFDSEHRSEDGNWPSNWANPVQFVLGVGYKESRFTRRIDGKPHLSKPAFDSACRERATSLGACKTRTSSPYRVGCCSPPTVAITARQEATSISRWA